MFYFRRVFIIITIILLLFCSYSCVKPEKKYIDTIALYADRYGVDPYLVLAIAYVESGFDAKAVSPVGAMGVMQIMPATGEWIAGLLGVECREDFLMDPDINIQIGTYYLSYLSMRFADDWQVYAAYNAGETAVYGWLEKGIGRKSIPYEETKEYVSKVERARKRFSAKKIFAF